MSAEREPVILCVDDQVELLTLLKKVLEPQYRVLTADNAGDAIALAGGYPRPDLVVLDIEMPGVSGFEVCRALKSEPATAPIPIIFLTSKTEPEAQVEGLELGAADYVTKPLTRALLRARVDLHLGLARRRLELERLVQSRAGELEAVRTEMLRCLARLLEYHDGKRGLRLANYAKLLAQAAGARPELADMMMKAAPVHDIGKLALGAEPRRHPELGAAILGELDDPLLKLARTLALTHQERWDGSGHPRGLEGEAIPWEGRVLAIAASFESLTAEGLAPDAAAAEITKHAGTKYDPALMEPLKRAVPVLTKIRNLYSER